jgi:hemoglobin
MHAMPALTEPAVTENQIVALVDAFYAKVQQDAVLAPVFDRAIAPDSWPVHLAKMYDFWSSVMLTTRRYKGNPMGVHMRVAGLEAPMFARWLALFHATAEELFPPALAANFREKSERIAESLQLGLFYRPGQGGLNIVPRSPS